MYWSPACGSSTVSACSGAEDGCLGGEGSFRKEKKRERRKMREKMVEVRKVKGNIRKG